MSPIDPKIETCWVDVTAIGFGITLYTCFCRSHIGPIGFVWGIRMGDKDHCRFDVVGSYVLPWARRFGVRRKINEVILDSHSSVSTPAASDEDAEFMKAAGYRYDKRLGQWSYAKPKKRKRK